MMQQSYIIMYLLKIPSNTANLTYTYRYTTFKLYSLPAPSINSITTQWAQFIIWICIFQVAVISMLKHLPHFFPVKPQYFLHRYKLQQEIKFIAAKQPIFNPSLVARPNVTRSVAVRFFLIIVHFPEQFNLTLECLCR